MSHNVYYVNLDDKSGDGTVYDGTCGNPNGKTQPEGMGMTDGGLGCEKYRIDPTHEIFPKNHKLSPELVNLGLRIVDEDTDRFSIKSLSRKNFYKNSREKP